MLRDFDTSECNWAFCCHIAGIEYESSFSLRVRSSFIFSSPSVRRPKVARLRNCAVLQEFTSFVAHFVRICPSIEKGEVTFNWVLCGELVITPGLRIFSFNCVHMADLWQVMLMSSSGPMNPYWLIVLGWLLERICALFLGGWLSLYHRWGLRMYWEILQLLELEIHYRWSFFCETMWKKDSSHGKCHYETHCFVQWIYTSKGFLRFIFLELER